MQAYFKKTSVVTAILMVTTLTASADGYDGSAALTFTLNSISNSGGNSSDLSNFSATALFQQPTDANNFYAATSGDGVYSANNPEVTAAPLNGNSFSGDYSVSATAFNGSVTTVTNGYYTLDFKNADGVNSYTVDLSLNYTLNADANGASLQAASQILLGYYYSGSNIVSEAASSAAGFGTDYLSTNPLSVGSPSDTETLTGSAEIVFTLAPGESEAFTANPTIFGTVQAVTAVPVPTAGWFFGSGWLGLMGLSRRKLRKK